MSTMTKHATAIDLLRSAYRDYAQAQRAGAKPLELGWLHMAMDTAERRCRRNHVTEQTMYDTAKAVAAELRKEVA